MACIVAGYEMERGWGRMGLDAVQSSSLIPLRFAHLLLQRYVAERYRLIGVHNMRWAFNETISL